MTIDIGEPDNIQMGVIIMPSEKKRHRHKVIITLESEEDKIAFWVCECKVKNWQKLWKDVEDSIKTTKSGKLSKHDNEDSEESKNGLRYIG